MGSTVHRADSPTQKSKACETYDPFEAKRVQQRTVAHSMKKPIHADGLRSPHGGSAYARTLAAVRRQRVHTFTRTGLPSFTTVTVCRFGLKRRRVCRCEKLTAFPNDGPLPHEAHFAIFRLPGHQGTYIHWLQQQSSRSQPGDCSDRHSTIARRVLQPGRREMQCRGVHE